MTTKKKLWIAVVVGLLVVIGTLGGVKALQIGTMMKAGASFAPPPETVTSAKVQAVEWQATRAAIGTLVSMRSVTLGAEVAGLVREIAFESGSAVRKGALLVRLDTSAEEAQLASASAEASLAKLNLDRIRSLREAGSGAPADLDTAEARAKQADAAVANLQAAIAKKTIRAPFDGRITIRQVELGQVVSSGAPVASLHSVTPIYADFWLPQQALAEIKVGQEARLRTDTFPGAGWRGSVSVVNPEVDVATRNVRIRATFENADGRLRPGMFANVEVLSAEKREALIVPATAVLYAPYGDSVFAIEAKKDPGGKESLAVRQKFVRTGDRRGDFVEVLSGLEVGETLVSNGAFKLRNGMNVVLNDALAVPASLEPRPQDR